MVELIFFVIALITVFILWNLKLNIVVIFLIAFFVLLVFNFMIGYFMKVRQRKVLDWDCDPKRYLKMMDEREKKFRKNKRVLSYLSINRAVGHLLLGNFMMAKEYLEGIDTSYLSEKNGSYFVYTIDLISCYYELGEIEKAENLYETNLVRLAPLGKPHKRSVEILIGERYYFQGKYEESYECLKKLLKEDLDKRQYLGILFRLAQMDLRNGETDQARKRFEKIAKLGNKLWIAKESGEILEKYDKFINAEE